MMHGQKNIKLNTYNLLPTELSLQGLKPAQRLTAPRGA